MLYNWTLLLIHSIYSSLQLLIPTSFSIPPSSPTVLATTSLSSRFMSLFLKQAYSWFIQHPELVENSMTHFPFPFSKYIGQLLVSQLTFLDAEMVILSNNSFILWGACPCLLTSRVSAGKHCSKILLWDFPGGPVVKTSASNAGDADSIPGWGAIPTHLLSKGPKHKNRSNFVNKINKGLKILMCSTPKFSPAKKHLGLK